MVSMQSVIQVYCTQVPRMYSVPTEKYTRRMIAITPAFATMPESSADAGAGAIGCAEGSQPCIGYIPALVPNPRIPRKITARKSGSGPDTFSMSIKPP